MSQSDKSNPFSSIKASKVIFPIIIGVGVVAWMFYREFKPEAFDIMSFTWRTAVFLLLAFLCMFARDFGYMIRIKVLADNQLTWMQSFRIIMLWEFTSAVTPSAIGGTSVAILFVHKEGLSLGKSSAIVLATSFLDELYFVLMFPLLLLIVNVNMLFTIGEHGSSFLNEFFWFAAIGYSIKLAYTLLVSYGLFINPRGLKWMLMQIFRLKWLRRWKHQINEAGYEIVESSRE
ncbi:MAG: flippase-like domain-containing protein, partial [Bacteroidales bacterium]|nr:flippase-like domain-containing protein [Bacteroidales bacterium]